jgi:hypothetical protein
VLTGEVEAGCEVGIFGFRAWVTGSPDLVREVETLFPPPPAWAISPDVTATVTFHLQSDTPRAGWCQVVRDGAPLWATDHGDEVLPFLEWAIMSAAVEHVGGRYVLFHAGAVAYAERGLILPAASGSGKTTLTAGLVAHGFQYLSDEVAALDPVMLRLVPFPKSLCVKPGARRALVRLYSQLRDETPRRRFGGEPVWYLAPGEGVWPPGPVPVRFVVLPRYAGHGRTTLTPIPRSAALQRLLEQSFSVRTHGAPGIGAIAEMLRGAACYALTVGDLSEAVEVLTQLVAS